MPPPAKPATYAEIAAQLPADAKWSCCFGNPGCQGYLEYWRDPRGVRWIIGNGPWSDPFPTWTLVTDQPATLEQ